MNSAKSLIFLFLFCFTKIYGSQSQVQKELTLNYNFMRRQRGRQVKICNSSASLAGTGHLPFTKIKLHVH